MHLPKLTQRTANGAVLLYGPFAIPGLAAERLVRVHVPADSVSPERRRPAFFLFDGQNLFDDAPSFSGGWGLHTMASSLGTSARPAPVLVGIDHGGSHRLDELSPFRTRQTRDQLPALAHWVAHTLAPALIDELRLDPHPASLIVGGSSMGGLAGLWTHLAHPERFGGALCMSPSFWLGDGALFDVVRKLERPARSRVYLDGGMREGRMVQAVERMHALLLERGWPATEVRLKVERDGGHDERSWARRAPSAMRYVLGARRRTRAS